MEWVETTGRTVEEAKEAALDELGVDEADAEFEVLAEPKAGLFGRLRSEARVRARVRPTAPRSKDDRRDRRQRAGRTRSKPGGGNGSATPAQPAAVKVDSAAAGEPTGAPHRNPSRTRRGGSSNERKQREGADVSDVEVALDEQGRIAEDFLKSLTAEFGVSASVTSKMVDDDTVEIQMGGSDLGLLIGPKGATLLAIQNLARTVVYHQTGATNGHINVDVGGYRQKRTEALVRFAQQVAANVTQSGARTALEPMSAVDRKVVHDTISAIEGVSTVSEGEEPRRRVVVLPAAGSAAEPSAPAAASADDGAPADAVTSPDA